MGGRGAGGRQQGTRKGKSGKRGKPSSGGPDVFVSYAGADRPWAEWVAWQLRDAGYSVELDVDWQAGDNIVLRMNQALERAGLIVMVWSPAYFERNRFTADEWTAVMAERPGDRQPLVPVRVAEVDPPRLLKTLAHRDLFGFDERKARATLLEAVGGARDAAGVPEFPGTAKSKVQREQAPRLPGALPPVWNVPRRSVLFTGRDGPLVALRERLHGGGAAVVQAVHGMGGVGKTTLAVEYAHRFAGTYDLVWWIDAEQPTRISDQFTDLGVAAGWISADIPTPDVTALVMQQLRRQSAWLLVFDNAERREDLQPWLPHGAGHVLITSRNPGWGQLVQPVPLQEFTRPESVALLRHSLSHLTDDQADELAGRLGDLPLAIAQAAQMLGETGMSVGDYLTLLSEQTVPILSEGVPDGYPAPLAAVIHTSMRRLLAEDETAVQLLRVCAFLAPEPIPMDLFTATPGALPSPLAEVVTTPLAFAHIRRRIAAFGLARVGEGTLQLHRLTQAVIRDSVDPADRPEARRRCETLLAAALPDDGRDPVHWPRWAQLTPHLNALDPATTTHDGLRGMACRATSYLLSRGDTDTAGEVSGRLYLSWQERFGPDDPYALFVGTNLALADDRSGRFTDAYELGGEIYDRRRRMLGDDHPDTLISANNLARTLSELGRHDEALDLHQDTYDRRCSALGKDHPETLISAGHLANSIRRTGRHQEALVLHGDAHDRRLRMFGDDHPSTMISAGNLADTLRALSRHDEALAIHEDTYDRHRRVLGGDHPDTLTAANDLATTLFHMSRDADAARLFQDTLGRSRRVLGEDHPRSLQLARSLAAVLGRRREALPLLHDTFRRYQRVLGDGHPLTSDCAFQLAGFLGATGRHRDALTPARYALQHRRGLFGDGHPDTVEAATYLVQLLRHAGRNGQARDVAQEMRLDEKTEQD